MGKEENVGYQHFLLFPHCFLKLSFPEALKVGIMLLWVNPIPNNSKFQQPGENEI